LRDSFDGLNPIAGVYPFAGFNNCPRMPVVWRMMVTMNLSSAVEARLVAMYPGAAADAARQVLDPRLDDQVLQAILTLSLGDLERLRHFSDVAAVDARDVLVWDGSPVAGEPASYDDLRERLNLPPET
jgi:hypothetical protein